jgi:RNA polymerase sigma factor (sigma-70 family)
MKNPIMKLQQDQRNPRAYEALKGQYWYILEVSSGYLKNDADWMQEALIILRDFALAWDLSSDKNFKFALYVKVKEASDHYYYHNIKKHFRLSHAEEALNNTPDPSEDDINQLDREWAAQRLQELLQKHLSHTDLKIISYYFYKNLTQKQISTKLKLDQATISRKIESILKNLATEPEFIALWENSRGLF